MLKGCLQVSCASQLWLVRYRLRLGSVQRQPVRTHLGEYEIRVPKTCGEARVHGALIADPGDGAVDVGALGRRQRASCQLMQVDGRAEQGADVPQGGGRSEKQACCVGDVVQGRHPREPFECPGLGAAVVDLASDGQTGQMFAGWRYERRPAFQRCSPTMQG